jgi:hypothetical protein
MIISLDSWFSKHSGFPKTERSLSKPPDVVSGHLPKHETTFWDFGECHNNTSITIEYIASLSDIATCSTTLVVYLPQYASPFTDVVTDQASAS